MKSFARVVYARFGACRNQHAIVVKKEHIKKKWGQATFKQFTLRL
jgi:hypothetical protein